MSLRSDHALWPEIRAHLAARHSRPRPGHTLAQNLVFPVAQHVWARYRRGILGPHLSWSRAAREAVYASLARRLASAVEHVAAREWNFLLNTPFLHIPSCSAEANTYLQRIFFAKGVEYQTLALTGSYPELTRIWLTQIKNWHLFFQAFGRDAARLVRRMRAGPCPRINSAQPDVSDFHSNNTTVIRVRFANGAEWFYKPRPVGQNAAWFKFLSRINEERWSHRFAVPRLVSARGHHWMEAIQESRCVNKRQQRDFWFRMGALLYLLNQLRAVDFHLGNLVCSVDQPVFVDCETLLHPETPMPLGVAKKETGLFRIGMLPLEEGAGVSTAALGPGTFARVSATRHRLGFEIAQEMVVDGFRAMHEFFMEEPRRVSILRDVTAQLSGSRCRIIYRPTAQYYFILQQSLMPDLLRATAERSTFLEKSCKTSPIPKWVSRNEAAALQNLDIPSFLGECSKSSGLPSTGEVKNAMRQIAKALAKWPIFLFVVASLD